MNVEELKARLQAEFSRREIFERKNADLEAINEKLRTENDGLLLEVRELKERVSFLTQEVDQSDSSEDEQDYESYVRGNQIATGKDQEETTPPPSSDGSLTANHNHCNSNGTTDHNVAGNHNNVAGNHDVSMERSSVKIQTLKRKQKALKAELEQSMYKTISFKEAFQKEMDLRTKLDDKFDNLRVRYERLVIENDDLRTVLINHCINVPPHQPITGKRQPKKFHLQHPPPFVPPGRPKSRLSSSSGGHAASSPNLSISSNKSSDHAPPTIRVSDSQERSSDEMSSSTKSPEVLQDESDASRKASESSRDLRADTPSSLGDVAELSGSDLSDEGEGENSSSGEGVVEHIVFEDSVETPTTRTPVTQEIDDLLVATSDQIENARIFYDLVRERLKLEEEESD